MKKQHFIALLIVILFGTAKLNFEQRLSEANRAAFFHGAKLDLSLRQQIGQAGFLAALGGFRSVVADFLWIEGHIAWEQTRWGRMALLFNDATTLQPRNLMFWDISAWQLGWNASIAALNDVHQPDKARRIETQHQYWKAAEDVYLRGIQNNPDYYYLYEMLADLYRDKFQDHLKAFEYYDKAARFPNAPIYEKRMAAYQLSYVPDREKEAYGLLLKYFNMGEKEHLPELLTRLQYLENKLNVPASQRVQLTPEDLQELKNLPNRENISPAQGGGNPDKKP